jgi:HEAT repeat protein
VRQAAIHSASLRRDRDAVSLLVPLLHQPSHHNRRAAAEALGRIGEKPAVPELLKAISELTVSVRTLEHSLTYALILYFPG